jgi:hypothetical protein
LSPELTSIIKAEVTAENRPAYDTSQHVCLNDGHNIRILASCSDLRRVSSEIPYHDPRPLCGNVCRIYREDPPLLVASLFSGWTRVLRALLRDTKTKLTQPLAVQFGPRSHFIFLRSWLRLEVSEPTVCKMC